MPSTMLEDHFNVLCNGSDDSERYDQLPISRGVLPIYRRFSTTLGNHVHFIWNEQSQCNLSNMRRACYILRQNTTMNHLYLSGYDSVPIDAIDPRPMSGFWLCVGIQVNQTIEELSLSYVDLSYDGDYGKMHIFGCFLETNPLLKSLKLAHCYLSCYDILALSRHVKNRSTNSIEEINLNNNSMDLDQLEDEEMENCFLEILYNLRGVKRLKLSKTGIGLKESIPVAKFLRRYCNNLEELDLSGNDTDRLLLIKALGDNSTLKTLNLGHRSKEEELNVRKQWMQLVCNGSSITSTMKSNHCISSWSEPRDDTRERRRIMTRRANRIEPVEHDEDTKLLLSSFRLNHKEYSFHLKARYKIMWHHIRGSYNIGGEETIPISALPRVISFFNVGYDSECQSCHDTASWSLDYRYDDRTGPGYYKTSPPPHSELNVIRLTATFRILQARPEICFESSTMFNQLKLLRCKNKHLVNEIVDLKSEVQMLREEIRRLNALAECGMS